MLSPLCPPRLSSRYSWRSPVADRPCEEGSMRRVLAWLVLGILVAAGWPGPRVFAQQDEAELVRKAEAFIGLWQRLEKTEDAAERIALSDQALKLEGEL